MTLLFDAVPGCLCVIGQVPDGRFWVEQKDCPLHKAIVEFERAEAAKDAVKAERRRVKAAIDAALPVAPWNAQVMAAVFPASTPPAKQEWVDMSKEKP